MTSFFAFSGGVASVLSGAADHRTVLQRIHRAFQRGQTSQPEVSWESSLSAAGHDCRELLCPVQKKILPTPWQTCSMETIRNRLIRHGSSIQVRDGIVRIRLNKSFPYPSEVLDILRILRQQVQIERAKKVCYRKRTEG